MPEWDGIERREQSVPVDINRKIPNQERLLGALDERTNLLLKQTKQLFEIARANQQSIGRVEGIVKNGIVAVIRKEMVEMCQEMKAERDNLLGLIDGTKAFITESLKPINDRMEKLNKKDEDLDEELKKLKELEEQGPAGHLNRTFKTFRGKIKENDWVVWPIGIGLLLWAFFKWVIFGEGLIGLAKIIKLFF